MVCSWWLSTFKPPTWPCNSTTGCSQGKSLWISLRNIAEFSTSLWHISFFTTIIWLPCYINVLMRRLVIPTIRNQHKGYILKPSFLRKEQYDPNNLKSYVSDANPQEITIKILTARLLNFAFIDHQRSEVLRC
jgi:hypothetical protein